MTYVADNWWKTCTKNTCKRIWQIEEIFDICLHV